MLKTEIREEPVFPDFLFLGGCFRNRRVKMKNYFEKLVRANFRFGRMCSF